MTLSVRNLSFSYSTSPVLRDISLDLEAGECITVLGVNGAGKSTLLKCIDGILPYSQGKVLLDGKDLTKSKPTTISKYIAYVPQNPEFGNDTVFDAVLIGRMSYIHWDTTEEDLIKVSKVLDQLSLSHLATRKVNDLSGGEKQKIAIARALAQDAKIILLDEPTSNLDIKNQIEVISMIRSIAKDRNIGVIATMHDLNLAIRLADRFLFMKDNSVFLSGGREVLTEDNLKTLYGLDLLVTRINGREVVLPR